MVKMFLFYKLRTTCKKSDSEWFLFKTANFDSHFLRTICLIKKNECTVPDIQFEGIPCGCCGVQTVGLYAGVQGDIIV